MKPKKHKEVEPVSLPRSSSSSTTTDNAGTQTLFVAVCYPSELRYFSSILQLDTKVNNHEYVAHFELQQGYPEPIRWMFSHLPCSPEGLCMDPEDLCMVPDWGRLYQKRAPLNVSIFNLWTKKCISTKPPDDPIYYEHVVDMGMHIYFLGESSSTDLPFFARYNRLKDSWETLQPFPLWEVKYWADGRRGTITATALWNNDTILLTLNNSEMWAYDVGTNKWYCVVDKGHLHYKIEGKAVVLDSTIYSLATKNIRNCIVAFSIKKKQTESGIVFQCSLIHDILVPCLDGIAYDDEFAYHRTRELVHLGGDNFCIVHSCSTCDSPRATQPIQVTYLKIKRKKPLSGTVTHSYVYDIKLIQDTQFVVELCFPLRECKATAFKEGKRCFAFDPFPEHYYAERQRPFIRRIDPPGLDVDFSSKPLQDKDSSQDEQGIHVQVAAENNKSLMPLLNLKPCLQSNKQYMDDAGPGSLFVVVSYDHGAPYCSSILQLDTEVNNHEYVSRFSHEQGYPPIEWGFSRLASSTEGLCFVPDWRTWGDHRKHVSLHGCVYNLRTNECKSIMPLRTNKRKSIKPPRGAGLYRHVVALGEHIYFMGTPDLQYDVPEAFFECYDLLTDSWETLRPFPYVNANNHRSDGRISGISACAVWDDTILLNMDGCGMWVYAVGKDQWYPVVDVENLRDDIVGKAVVLDNNIYFLGNVDDLVVALSLKREEIDGVPVFKCSLRCKIMVPGMDKIKFEQANTCWRTRDLVHLGEENFCIVRSCHFYGSVEYQPIQLTKMKLKKGGNSMTVTDTFVHHIKLEQNQQFEVRLCFSLPFRKRLDVQEEKGTVSSRAGHCIYVRKLLPDATVTQLEKRLKKFGPIKRDGILLSKKKEGECFAFVEFESEASKQRAIEAFTIKIGGCLAELLEKVEH